MSLCQCRFPNLREPSSIASFLQRSLSYLTLFTLSFFDHTYIVPPSVSLPFLILQHHLAAAFHRTPALPCIGEKPRRIAIPFPRLTSPLTRLPLGTYCDYNPNKRESPFSSTGQPTFVCDQPASRPTVDRLGKNRKQARQPKGPVTQAPSIMTTVYKQHR